MDVAMRRSGLRQRWAALWALAAFPAVALGGWVREVSPDAALAAALGVSLVCYAGGWWVAGAIEGSGLHKHR